MSSVGVLNSLPPDCVVSLLATDVSLFGRGCSRGMLGVAALFFNGGMLGRGQESRDGRFRCGWMVPGCRKGGIGREEGQSG